MMIRDHARRYRIQNLLHTCLLLAGMMVLLGIIGWVMAGSIGMIWALITGMTVIMSTSRYSYHLILYLTGARPLSADDNKPLNGILYALAERSQMSHIPKLYYLPTMNLMAFSTGMQNDSAVAISEGLLRELDIREMTAVLAHEISHISSNDLWMMAVADSINRLTRLMALTGYILLILYLPMYLTEQQVLPWLVLILLILAPVISAMMQLALSRIREFNADMLAVSLTGDPEGLISALIKIERLKKDSFIRLLLPDAYYPSMLRTHPLTEQRIQRLHAMAKEFHHPFVGGYHV